MDPGPRRTAAFSVTAGDGAWSRTGVFRPVPPYPRPHHGGDPEKTTPGRRVPPTCPEARGIHHPRTTCREPQP
ncbi:hypothetical protein GCM10010298_38740 [Streptomyces microflavus]|nr:hypothetical protein GCM10010298_38740 [Streptomyces microflavus]